MEMKNSTPISVLLDEKPLSLDLLEATDYCALQVLSLCALPLTKETSKEIIPLGAESWKVNKSNTQFTFKISKIHRWENGSEITGYQYENSFRTILNKKNFRFKKLLNDLSANTNAIISTRDSITFNLRQANAHFPNILSLACFSPLSNKKLFAGPYSLEKDSDNIQLKRNPFFPTKSKAVVERIRFEILKDKANFEIDRVLNNQLDRSCDTAFPYHRINENRENLINTPEQLIALLSLGNLASKPDIKTFRQLATKIDKKFISDKLFGALKPITSYGDVFGLKKLNAPLPSALSISRKEIVLAYENYYPNLEICQSIAAEWKKLGIKVNLKEEAYGSRSLDCHLRFEIRQSPLKSPFLFFRSEVSNTKFYKFSEKFSDALKLFSKYQISNDREALEKLNTLLSKEGCSFPLFEIPALVLQNKKLAEDNSFKPGQLWRFA